MLTLQSSGMVILPFSKITGVHSRCSSGCTLKWHAHEEGQLTYCHQGLLVVKTHQGNWTVSSSHALWIPANEPHEIEVSRATRFQAIYVDVSARPHFSMHSRTLMVSSLLHELIQRSLEKPKGAEPEGYRVWLSELLLSEMFLSPLSRFQLPYPNDQRVAEIVRRIEENPGDRMTLKEWAKNLRLSDRTIERVFQKETGLSFHNWRLQIRIFVARQLLESGASVKEVAYGLNFKNPSTFIAMFRKVTGETPGEYHKGKSLSG